MTNKNDNLVVAYFNNRAAAEAAVDDLKDWDKANDSIKLGAIAVLTLNEKTGHLEAHEVGQRDAKKGALWGAGIGVVAGILTAGIGLIPGIILGGAAGGGLGALNHKSVGMSDDDREQMANNLKNGGAALAVMADGFEVEATEAELGRLGGRTSHYSVPEATVVIVDEAVEMQTSAVAAIGDAVDSATDEVADATRAVGAYASDLGAAATASVGALAAAASLSPENATKLNSYGVDSPKAYLSMAATPAGRAELAAETGVSEEEILLGVKRLDLMRVKGVGAKYSALLVATGVDSVVELARRNASNLAAAMATTNSTANMVDELPSEEQVNDWVVQAKDMPRVVEF